MLDPQICKRMGLQSLRDDSSSSKNQRRSYVTMVTMRQNGVHPEEKYQQIAEEIVANWSAQLQRQS